MCSMVVSGWPEAAAAATFPAAAAPAILKQDWLQPDVMVMDNLSEEVGFIVYLYSNY